MKAYTIVEHDTGHWRVLYYGKPVGIFGLTLKLEVEAEAVAEGLNRALELARGQGYDQGQADASRARWSS